MREFIKSGRTKKGLKVPMLAEYSHAYDVLHSVELMVGSSIHTLKEGLAANIQKDFGNETGDVDDFSEMLELLNVAIGKAQAKPAGGAPAGDVAMTS